MNDVPVTWADRETPLAPCAVAAVDRYARRLAQRLLELDRTALGRLSGVAGKHSIVVIGDEKDLPWVDGVVYLGSDSSAPALLLPTQLTPIIPGPHLLEKALRKRFPKEAPPLAIHPYKTTIFPCGQALRLEASKIEKWLDEDKT